jgi:hypothetical protein
MGANAAVKLIVMCVAGLTLICGMIRPAALLFAPESLTFPLYANSVYVYTTYEFRTAHRT